MKAISLVTPGSLYHLKFAIADAFDAYYDSGIFLEAGSLKSTPVTSYPFSSGDTATSVNYAIEGCLPAKIVFKRKNLTPNPFVFNFTYSGNAVAGVDYTTMPTTLSIPSMDSVVTLPIQALSDAIIESNDSIIITATNALTGYNEVFVYKIYDNTISIFNKTNDTSVCNNKSVVLSSIVTNPIAKVLWTPSTFLNNQNIFSPTSTPSLPVGTSNITYNVHISSKGCTSIDSMVKINVGQIPMVNLGNDTTICLKDTLKLRSTLTSPDSFGITWNAITNLSNKDSINCKFFPDSTYSLSVLVTTKFGCTVRDTITVSVSNIKKELTSVTKLNPTCKLSNGSVEFFVSNTFAPYQYSINNGPFSPTKLFTGLNGTSNLFSIKNNFGCKMDTIIKLLPDTIKLSVGTIVHASCQLSNGSVSSVLSGGINPVSYSWSNGATTPNISNVPGGNYKLILTDANNCKDSINAIVNSTPSISFLLSKTDALCSISNGQITSNTSNGSAPYTYLWNTGQTTSSITNLSGGWYKLTVTDAKGCVKSDSVFVKTYTKPILSLTKTDNKCNQNNGSVVSSVLNGTGTFTYYWNTGAATANLSGLIQNSYTLTVTDSAGCKDTASISITDFPSPILSTNSKSDAKCGLANGLITTNINLGTAPYSYSWSNGASTPNIVGLLPSTYSVTVTDANNCKDTLVETIINRSLPLISLVSFNQKCGVSNGSITCNVIGSIGPITYLWSNGATSKSISNLVAGKYIVTITDSLQCSKTDSLILGQFTKPILTLTKIDNKCNQNNGSISSSIINGTGTKTYLWNTGATSAVLSGLTQGNFTLTVTDSAGCKDTASISIIDYPSPILITNTKTNAKCGLANGSITTNTNMGTAPYNYIWSNGATTSNVSNLVSNTYSVTVTDANNCKDTLTETIVNFSLPQLSVSYKKQTCDSLNASMEVIPSGGYKPYTFVWSNSGSNSSKISGLSQGTYSVTVTDSLNCSVTATQSISAIPSLHTSKVTKPNRCGLQNALANVLTVQGTAPYSYSWTQDSLKGNLISNSNKIVNVPKGTYFCITTDSYNCSVTDTFFIDSFAKPKITLTSINSSCNKPNGKITTSIVNAFNPILYSWNNGATSKDLLSVSNGVYTLTITDSLLCQDTASISVLQDQNLVNFSLSKQDLTCYNNYSGSISVNNTSGGIAPYKFKTNTTSLTSNNVFSGLASGLYTITAEDNQGCTKSDTIRLNEPSELNIKMIKVQDLKCYGEPMGSIEVVANGGTPGYQYHWINLNVNGPAVNNIYSRYHVVQVLDSNNCSKIDSFFVNQPKEIKIESALNHLSCFNANDGSIIIKVSGGVSPYSYVWSNGQTSNTLSHLKPGFYRVSITDDNHCLDTFGYEIKNTDSFKFDSIVRFSPSCLNYFDGSATIYVSGGNGAPYLFKTSEDSKYTETKRLLSLTNKQYILQVLDRSHCLYSDTFIISKPNEINISLVPRDTITLDLGSSIDITCQLTKGSDSSISRYAWSPFDGLNCNDCKTVTASPYISRVYVLTVYYNQDKCATKDSLWIKIRNNEELYVPSAFAPFSDLEENKTFKIFGNLLKYSNMMVFDRWGEKVFEGDNVHQTGWDGTYKGELLSNGIYTYVVNVQYLDNKKIVKKGIVNLIR
jgi:gliding motility-associated-like protein